jgi:hypothetical protein
MLYNDQEIHAIVECLRVHGYEALARAQRLIVDSLMAVC